MTDKMKNTLAHIQTATDVDEWAADEVEKIFIAYDAILFMIKDVRDHIAVDAGDMSQGMYNGLDLAAGLLEEGMR